MEISDIGANDCAEATRLLSEITKNASGVNETFQALLKELSVKYQTGKGISFLEVKFHTILDYLINLAYIMFKRVSGTSIKNDPAIERIVELRTVLEKIKPIDQKLRHHVDKLLDIVATGAVKPNDPLRYKANPQKMIAEESDRESVDGKEDKLRRIYVPPRIKEMHYDADETSSHQKAISMHWLQIKEQYEEGPEEIRESDDFHTLEEKKIKDRVRYEEEHMIRLPVAKKQRRDTRQVVSVSDVEMGVDDVLLKKESKKLSAKKRKRK